MLSPQNTHTRGARAASQRSVCASPVLPVCLCALSALLLLTPTITAPAANIVTGTKGVLFDSSDITSARARSALPMSSGEATALLSPRVLRIGVIDVQHGISSFNPAAKVRYSAGSGTRLALIRVAHGPHKPSATRSAQPAQPAQPAPVPLSKK